MPVQLEHLVGDRAAGVKEAEAGLVSFAGTKERRLNRNLRAEATLPAAALRFIRRTQETSPLGRPGQLRSAGFRSDS